MKKVFFFLLIICTIHVSAQDKIHHIQDVFPTENISMQTDFIKRNFNELNIEAITLALQFQKASPYSNHYTYDILYQGHPLFGQYIKVSTDKKNNIISISTHIGNLEKISASDILRQASAWQEPTSTFFDNTIPIKKKTNVLVEKENGYELMQLQQAWNKSNDQSKLIDKNNQEYQAWDHLRRANIDTFINAEVFSPDPLTFLNQNYGGIYIDNNDMNAPWMNAAYIPVNIEATYDNITDSFYLENSLVKIIDFEAPSIAPTVLSTPQFNFDRSQAGFEECMILYHIGEFHNHIASLGYDTLMKLQVEADAHGQFGGDNSVFNRNGGAPTLTFGTGGVDDAEDADVIIHEYGHGISWSANNNGFMSNERKGLDEGIGDYFCTSYSRNLSNFRWQDVFTWDGHNTFFNGRSAVVMANYAIPFPGGLYDYGNIWNTAMQNIYADLGRNTTDALMLETLFYLTDNSTLPAAAYYMLQADSVINGGVNVPTICTHFQQKNILTGSCYATSTQNLTNNLEQLKISNTLAFTQGTGKAFLHLDHEKYNITLYTMEGQVISSIDQVSGFYSLSPDNLANGLYILKVYSKNGFRTFKLMRE